MNKKAICISSGGVDSTTAIAIAKSKGFDIYSLSFEYGQRNKFEIRSAKKIAKFFGAKKHLIVKLDLKKIGGSAILDKSIRVPKKRSMPSPHYTGTVTPNLYNMGTVIPITYVPARNTIFLSYAVSWAEVIGAGDIFIGVNAIDYSGYPDCRPEYIKAFEKLANLATKAGVEKKIKFKINTPLIYLSKAEIIKKGIKLGVDYSLTNSCYDPHSNGKACGKCDACVLRLKGFEEAGLKDPVKYIHN